MSGPKRIQRKRTKGWRMPDGAVYVGRPTKWGNPYRVGHFSQAQVVASFRSHLLAVMRRPWTESHDIDFRVMAESLGELRGHDLVCWCGPDEPCHADVLLELANALVPASTTEGEQ